MKKATANNGFKKFAGDLLYAPFLQTNYVSTWAEFSASNTAIFLNPQNVSGN